MPELPEVEVTRRGLLPLLQQKVRAVAIRAPALRWPIPEQLPQLLHEQTLLQLARRGKYIIARFGSGSVLLHLGMSGHISLLQQDQPPAKHDHFDISFYSGQVLRLNDARRFGAVLWAGAAPEQHVLLKTLGLEPLEPEFDGDWLYQRLRNRSVAIKNAVMDSHLVVGVGNIYASESLFRAGIHPAMPAGKLSRARCHRLVEAIKETLTAALVAGGSTVRDFQGADGGSGYFQLSCFVYGRDGQPCKTCGTPVKIMRQGQRSTFFCSRCQRH